MHSLSKALADSSYSTNNIVRIWTSDFMFRIRCYASDVCFVYIFLVTSTATTKCYQCERTRSAWNWSVPQCRVKRTKNQRFVGFFFLERFVFDVYIRLKYALYALRMWCICMSGLNFVYSNTHWIYLTFCFLMQPNNFRMKMHW